MQVAAMLRGGKGAMKVGEGGLWAMIERNLGALRFCVSCTSWPGWWCRYLSAFF